MKRKYGKDISSFFLKSNQRECAQGSNHNSTTQPSEPTQPNSSQCQETHQTPIIHENEEEPDFEGTSFCRPQASNMQRLSALDVETLPHDPGLRRKMSHFHPNDLDLVRRHYIAREPCQPETHAFPFRLFGKKNRRFNPKWFEKYRPWLEYSVEKDAAFCFACYLFKDDNVGSDAFVSDGFRTWSRTDAFANHVGGHMSFHNQAIKALQDFKNQKGSIISSFSQQSEQSRERYKKRLVASIKCLKWLLLQGLPARGHDESVSSSNRGNFLELLKFHVEDRDIEEVVLDNAPGNCQMVSPTIQKDIINACASLTTRAVVEEIGDDFFTILADESSDISDKEQLGLCLRYVNKKGEVTERFLGLVHVANTTSLTLKQAIESLLMEHSLSLSQVRGQGYDGASNMCGTIRGLKTLIMDENKFAYYVHCFAHQLQLTLVSVAKKNSDCEWLFSDALPLLLNFVGGSPKRKEFLRQKQRDRVVEALSLGELETGSGLNQELGLGRPADTRWGSHFKTIKNVLDLYVPILESLDEIAKSTTDVGDKRKACAITNILMSFDFVFVAHLMGSIFGITNNLNLALQRSDQDIVNAMNMVDMTKRSLQRLRDDGWESHLNKVTSFMEKHGIEIPNMEARYVVPGRRFFRGNPPFVSNLHHFRVEVFLHVIDSQLQELESRFDEKTKEILVCMSCFNPTNRFESFSIPKLMRLAEFYENEFPSGELIFFDHLLGNFIDDMQNDESFWNLKNLNELSMKLVETKKHDAHPQVFLLLKLVLLLPVATATVERAFSGMNLIKSKLRSTMGDQLLNDSLVSYLERDVLLDIEVDDIVNRFQNMRTRREQI